MFEKLKQWIFEQISESQIVFDLVCDVLEDLGFLTSDLKPTLTAWASDYPAIKDFFDAIPERRRGRSRRSRRRRRRRSR